MPDPGTLRGDPFDAGTFILLNELPSRPLGTIPGPVVPRPVLPVDTAVYGLVFELPSIPEPSRYSFLGQLLTNGNILDDVLKEFANQVANGSITVNSSGKATATSPASQWSGKLIPSGTTVLKDRFFNTSAVQALKNQAENKLDAFASDIWGWAKSDWTHFCVVAMAAAVGGGAVALGTRAVVGYINSTKNDTVGGLIADVAKIPKITVGKIVIEGGKTTWVPSKGTWSTAVSATEDWQLVKNLKLRGQVEIAASNRSITGKETATLTYHVGHAWLDDVIVRGTGASTGKYDLYVGLEKSLVDDQKHKIDLTIGGTFQGDVGSRSNGLGFGGQVGIKFTIGDGK